MPNYLVIYDRSPGVDYGPLHKHLQTYPTHWNFQKSAWIVGPGATAFAVANAAKDFLDAGDLLFVQEVTQDSAWWGYEDEGSKWIESVVP